jgi:predicted nucleic acid-binding protein
MPTEGLPEGVLVGTSVIVKWFHSTGEDEVPASRAVLAAHRDDLLTAQLLDLALYELGNVLVRALGWSGQDTADQLDDLLVICGAPLVPTPAWRRDAAELAASHRLSYYDASYAAAARALAVPLITADRKLIVTGLAESPSQFALRTGLAAQ